MPAQLAAEGFALQSWATRFDLELYITEDDAGMDGLFIANQDLFEPATVARLAAHCTALLTRLLADPDACVDDAEILGAAERAELITGFNDTAGEFPSEMTLHGLVEAQAARSPDAVAVTFDWLNVPSGARTFCDYGYGILQATLSSQTMERVSSSDLKTKR